MALDKAKLLASRAQDTTREVELPSGIGSVVVRGLTRKEALSIEGKELDEAELERKALAMALVDPQLTEAEIEEWQEGAPAGDLTPVTLAVLELSGMRADVTKEAMARFRD